MFTGIQDKLHLRQKVLSGFFKNSLAKSPLTRDDICKIQA